MKWLTFGTEVGSVFSSYPPVDAWSASPGIIASRPQYGMQPPGLFMPAASVGDNLFTGRSIGQRIGDGSMDMPLGNGVTTKDISLLVQKVKLELDAFARDVNEAMKLPALTTGELANAKDFYAYVNGWLTSEPSIYWRRNAARADQFLTEIASRRRLVAEKVSAVTAAKDAQKKGLPTPAPSWAMNVTLPPAPRPSIWGPVLAAVAGVTATAIATKLIKDDHKRSNASTTFEEGRNRGSR